MPEPKFKAGDIISKTNSQGNQVYFLVTKLLYNRGDYLYHLYNIGLKRYITHDVDLVDPLWSKV